MTIEEFHTKRKPFYIEGDSLLIQYPSNKHMNASHADWFTDYKWSWCHAIRGYIWESEEETFAMIYWNDFEIPNVSCVVINYIFEMLPNVKWIGLGCHKGQPGEIWEPKLKVYRNDSK